MGPLQRLFVGLKKFGDVIRSTLPFSTDLVGIVKLVEELRGSSISVEEEEVLTLDDDGVQLLSIELHNVGHDIFVSIRHQSDNQVEQDDGHQERLNDKDGFPKTI